MSSEPAITVRGISKSYKLGLTGRSDSLLKIIERRARHPFRGRVRRELFTALDDLTFDVEHGEAVGVVGKNGAGKSTLLKILSRITPPTSGWIEMAGNVGSLLEVGTGFHPELTGLENVYLNGTILGMSRAAIDRRLEEIVDFAEVDKFLDTPVKRYSSGMRVRLAFAVAAHLDPEILIVDEVLSVGDAGFQAKCIDKMKSIASDEGRTVLYVSHNLVTLEHLCPRSLLLADGRLVFDGPTEETVARYLRTFPQGQQSDTIGVFDLDAADRSGSTYHKVFKRLELHPGGGAPSDSIRMGDRLQVEIAVAGLDEVPDPVLAVTFSSSLSQNLFRVTSQMQPLRSSRARQHEETIVLDLPSLPLTPGEYAIEVHLKSPQGTVDYVHRAGSFTVIPANVLGTGYHYNAGDGHFAVPFEWELRPSADDDVSPNVTRKRSELLGEPRGRRWKVQSHFRSSTDRI
jgi:lipopolysaccharide transport system ATP-binding protein